MTIVKARISIYIAVFVCIAAASMPALAQNPTPKPAPTAHPTTPATPSRERIPRQPFPGKVKVKEFPPEPPQFGETGTYEKSIKVDPKVNLSMCVTEGNVKVNGWSRNEVRVFVKDGNPFALKVIQKGPRSGDPVWISIFAAATSTGTPMPGGECISAEDIEVDVPDDATFNIKGKQTRIAVDGIRKTGVINIGGDISIRNIAEGVSASTGQGDVMVENCEGSINLQSSTGNIVVFGASPSQVGDSFRAKTNSGAIALQRVEHRQIDVNSISGVTMFDGELLSGGVYSFGTTNGSIRVAIPQDSSFMIDATYGFGNFNSELPIKTNQEDVQPGGVKRVRGQAGSGDARLSMTTSTGQIRIIKR
jgi:hypothetical protein